MVGRDRPTRSYRLEEVLTERQIQLILRKVFKDDKCELISGAARAASAGLAGFLAEHVRAALLVRQPAGPPRDLPLFLKRVPRGNKPKADFIQGNNYFKRENLVFSLLEEMKGGEGPDPWCARAYINIDSLIVMPDLAAEGYIVRPLLETLDLRHVMLTVASVARFHAAFANYETNKTIDTNGSYDFYREFGHVLAETTFQDTPWLRTGAKLTADLIDAFSDEYRGTPALEDNLAELFVRACDGLHVVENSLNVIVHKDLWINNILYRYEAGEPAGAVLIDYQCARYGPPAFDVTSFLYLNTTRQFRAAHEAAVFEHYFKVFTDALAHPTRRRLDAMGYDLKEFLSMCEKSRMFAAFIAIAIFPQVLMDATSADRVFNDPETFMKLLEQDRTAPVLAYAEQCPVYKARILEVSEEFVERYVIGQK